MNPQLKQRRYSLDSEGTGSYEPLVYTKFTEKFNKSYFPFKDVALYDLMKNIMDKEDQKFINNYW